MHFALDLRRQSIRIICLDSSVGCCVLDLWSRERERIYSSKVWNRYVLLGITTLYRKYLNKVYLWLMPYVSCTGKPDRSTCAYRSSWICLSDIFNRRVTDTGILPRTAAQYTVLGLVRFENFSRNFGTISLWKFASSLPTSQARFSIIFRGRKAWIKVTETSYIGAFKPKTIIRKGSPNVSRRIFKYEQPYNTE